MFTTKPPRDLDLRSHDDPPKKVIRISRALSLTLFILFWMAVMTPLTPRLYSYYLNRLFVEQMARAQVVERVYGKEAAVAYLLLK